METNRKLSPQQSAPVTRINVRNQAELLAELSEEPLSVVAPSVTITCVPIPCLPIPAAWGADE
jgi:hypothetical protein